MMVAKTSLTSPGSPSPRWPLAGDALVPGPVLHDAFVTVTTPAKAAHSGMANLTTLVAPMPGAAFMGVARDFVGTPLANTADADAGVLQGFTGGTLADLQDGVGDHFTANSGNDLVIAGSGDDLIEGGNGGDTLRGSAGDDTLDGGVGSDLMDGGAGVNTVTFATATAAEKINLVTGIAFGGAGSDILTGFANVVGSAFDDTVTGDAAANQLYGGAGNDVLIGADGADGLFGGSGDDRLIDLSGAGSSLEGGAGDDVLLVGPATSGSLFGGEGRDAVLFNGVDGSIVGLTLTGVEELQTFGRTVTGLASQFEAFTTIRNDGTGATDANFVRLTLAASGGPVELDLSAMLKSGAAVRGVLLTGSADVETLTLGDGADTVSAGDGADTLSGGAGADQLMGDAGDDRLYGGTQDDRLYGGTGDDRYFGGAGSDAVQDDFEGSIWVSGDTGNDQVTVARGGVLTGIYDGGAGTDALILTDPADIRALTLTGVEVLSTYGFGVAGFASQFAQFTAILANPDSPWAPVRLTLVASGAASVLDLSAALAIEGTPQGVNLATSSDAETITTGAGNDTIIGSDGQDILRSGDGDDLIVLVTAPAVVEAGSGNDRVDLASPIPGPATLDGGAGQDTLSGAISDISNLAITGFEVLEITLPQAFLATAAALQSFSTIKVAGSAVSATVFLDLVGIGTGTTLDLSAALVRDDGFRAVWLRGSADDETITGGGAADTLMAGSGNDMLCGGDGNDLLEGGAGHDQVFGGTGDDTILQVLGTAVTLDGGDGDDLVTIGASGTFGSLAGGAGTDRLEVDSASGAIRLNGLAISEVEVLLTGGATVTARADQFAGFQTIALSSTAPGALVTLVLATSGTTTALDLGPRIAAQTTVFLAGCSDAEAVTGHTGADHVQSADGDDSLYGLGGNDTLSGGGGNDLIWGGTGDDALRGAHGDDVLCGDTGNDSLSDSVVGLVALDGGAGDDVITINGQGALAGVVEGGTGADRLVLNAAISLGSATVQGIETLETRGHAITGRADQFAAFNRIERAADAAATRLDLVLRASDAATVLDLSSALTGAGAPRRVVLTTSSDAETITLGDGHDAIRSGGSGDDLRTGAGDDRVVLTNAGQVRADTGTGDDLILLSPGVDLAAVLDGGAGFDTLRAYGDLTGLWVSNIETLLTLGGTVTARAATFGGFARIQTDYLQPTTPVTLRLSASAGATALDLSQALVTRGVAHAANLTGSADDESLTTSGANDTLDGGAGNDTLVSGGGRDLVSDHSGTSLVVNAGAGDDIIDIAGTAFATGRIDGGSGTDTLRALDADLSGLTLTSLQVLDTGGGMVMARAPQLDGFDRIQSAFGPVRLELVATGSATRLDLSDALDLTGASAQIAGSSDGETIVAGAGNDSLAGGAGRDDLAGGGGSDLLRGGAGNDSLSGGAGDDTLTGDLGADQLTGGPGADTFWFRAERPADTDLVTDFTPDQDHILLTRFDFGNFDRAAGTTLPASDWFTTGSDVMAADRNDRFLYDTTTGRLYFDFDGSGPATRMLVATFANPVNGPPLITAADFLVLDTLMPAI